MNSASWHEVIGDDEAARDQAFAKAINHYQQGFARRGDGQAHRGFHVKSHAALTAEFRVLDDIPPEAKFGVFASAGTFQAWIRLTNGFSAARADWFPDLVGLSVKLLGVPGRKLLDGEEQAGSQDFIALNQPYLPASNPAQLVTMVMTAANVLTAPFKLIQGLGVTQALRVMLWTLAWTPRRLLLRSVATEDFYSAVPITIGPHAVKFKWRARPQAATNVGHRSWSNYFRDDLRQRLADGDLHFDLLVQFYLDPVRTPIDGAYPWKVQDAPFVKLAELTVSRRDVDSEEAKREERHINGVSFNPWHAIAEHRPIGNIQRARRVVYQASAAYWGRDPDPRG
jgi:hypothetical protein